MKLNWLSEKLQTWNVYGTGSYYVADSRGICSVITGHEYMAGVYEYMAGRWSEDKRKIGKEKGWGF